MRQRTKLKLIQLAVIVGAWLMVALLMSIYDHLLLNTTYSQGPSNEYSFRVNLLLNSGSALMGSLLGGSFLVFYINERYQDKSYGYTIAAVSLSYIVVIILIIVALGLIYVPIKTAKPLSDPAGLAALKAFLFDTSRIKNTLFWSIVVSITQLLLQFYNKFGHTMFGNIIRGKYNTPQEERKIFMFLDLNSSTTIAEQLGDEKYHEFLKEFFEDITNPILENKGEIYQYVGDEVVVMWNHQAGIEDNRCVRCFYDIKLQVEKNKGRYLQRFGFTPSFKAGIHSGTVVAGEVGVIKRDITYSGDVVNTTSRIQSMCKAFDAEVIASTDLLRELKLVGQYAAHSLGAIKLRGKTKEVLISTLKPLGT